MQHATHSWSAAMMSTSSQPSCLASSNRYRYLRQQHGCDRVRQQAQASTWHAASQLLWPRPHGMQQSGEPPALIIHAQNPAQVICSRRPVSSAWWQVWQVLRHAAAHCVRDARQKCPACSNQTRLHHGSKTPHCALCAIHAVLADLTAMLQSSVTVSILVAAVALHLRTVFTPCSACPITCHTTTYVLQPTCNCVYLARHAPAHCVHPMQCLPLQ
jgi:hypothetical protein